MNDKLVSESIALIRRAERLALAMQPDYGFHVAFSGGKDSQVVLELAKMAGVRFRASYNVTTNDPAENVRFIKQNYPEVEFCMSVGSLLGLIPKKGLPTIRNRWCCARFKESSGVGSVVLVGVRREESWKRAGYSAVTKWSSKKDTRSGVDIAAMEANEFKCVGGKDKFVVYPILEWKEKDVWEFIKERELPVNPVYAYRDRVGCVICPFARPKDIREYCRSHPRLYEALIHAIEKLMERKGDKCRFSSAEDYFDWYLSKMSIDDFLALKRQLKLFKY